MLSDILQNKKCFKLVCGAGNEDCIEVEKLVTLYSKAGCNFFDLSANPNVIDAAKRGLKRSAITNDRYLCVSVGIKGDPHISKANLDSKTCTQCLKCTKICPQNAIVRQNNILSVNKVRCIGCEKCEHICPTHSITMESQLKDLKEVLPPLIKKGIDCIEFHALSEDEDEILQKWADINKMYNGILSICIDRSRLGNKKVLALVNKMLNIRKPFSTIIQADGAPMSGGNDNYKTTLQAIATAEIFQNAKTPAYILLSGGTNSKTTELAKLCEINTNGVAIGSFARKIVREYIDRDDFLENEKIFNNALLVAKNLIDVSLKNLGV